MHLPQTYNQLAKHTYDAKIRKDVAVRYRFVRKALRDKENINTLSQVIVWCFMAWACIGFIFIIILATMGS